MKQYSTRSSVVLGFILIIMATVFSGCASKGYVQSYYDEEVIPQLEKVNEDVTTQARRNAEEDKKLSETLNELQGAVKKLAIKLDDFDARFTSWEDKIRGLDSSIQDSLAKISVTREEAEKNVEQLTNGLQRVLLVYSIGGMTLND